LFNEKYFFEQYTVYVIAKVQVNKSGKEWTKTSDSF
jgi:hypothetical protein